MYHNLVPIPIQYRLIEKVDYIGWFKRWFIMFNWPRRLGRLGDQWLIRSQPKDGWKYEIVLIRLDLSHDWSYDWSYDYQIYDITFNLFNWPNKFYIDN